jgi:glycosyltransferase involved in cell wall biosynthesis
VLPCHDRRIAAGSDRCYWGTSVAARLEITVLCDGPDENWPSMDLAAEMLLRQWDANPSLNVVANRLSIRIPPVVRRLPGARSEKMALNADRAIARYLAYPIHAVAARRPGRLFHVVDHSYAHLVHALPGARTGVYCHDLDAFLPLVTAEKESWPRWRRSLARVLLAGMRSAAVVFHSTRDVGRALEGYGLVPRSRLVRAPYGVAPEFVARQDPADGADVVLSPLEGRPFLLHVGSGIARKRLDVLFEVFARLRASHPQLRLVQQGASLSAAQLAHVEQLGIGDALVQPPKLPRATLAGLYRRASLVLVTSDSEGFGFPVIEAMACGAMVLASDVPVLKEVGGTAALYAPVGDVPAWTAMARALLREEIEAPPKAVRLARAGEFTWDHHALTILEAYREVEESVGGVRRPRR